MVADDSDGKLWPLMTHFEVWKWDNGTQSFLGGVVAFGEPGAVQ